MSDSTDSTGDFDQATAGRTTLRYLARAMHTDHPSDEPFVLNSSERHAINRIKGATMLVSSALGVLAIWVFYLPHVLWADWFAKTHTALGDWPLISLLFGLLIIYLLLHALILTHSGAIRLIEMTCQFPRFHDSSYNRHLNVLADNGRRQGQFRPRMSPRPLLPWTLSGYLVTVLLLAFVSGGLVQLALRLWNGQPVSPMVTVLSSTLVLAVWNSWATYRILQQAQIRVMVPLTVRQFINELAEEFGREPHFRQASPGILQQAGISAKPDNYPHLLLMEAMISRFSIESETVTKSPSETGPEHWTSCPKPVRQGLERLFVFSLLIDGHLSSPEKKRLRQLQQTGGFRTSVADAETMRRNFVRGEGLWV
ncbi:LBF_2804 family protein [Larkinella ripae]